MRKTLHNKNILINVKVAGIQTLRSDSTLTRVNSINSTLELITCPPANQIARNVSPAGALNRLMHTLYRLMHTLSSTRTRRPREEL